MTSPATQSAVECPPNLLVIKMLIATIWYMVAKDERPTVVDKQPQRSAFSILMNNRKQKLQHQIGSTRKDLLYNDLVSISWDLNI